MTIEDIQWAGAAKGFIIVEILIIISNWLKPEILTNITKFILIRVHGKQDLSLVHG
jgi:hypothetical protein